MSSTVCDMTYYGEHPPKGRYFFSCSIFKLQKSYRTFGVYIQGLDNILKYIKRRGDTHFLRVYYDDSLQTDEQFQQLVQTHSKGGYAQFCHYKCPLYMQGEYHKGIFGMFVRFYPYFDANLQKTMKCVTCVDIDLTEGEMVQYLSKIPEAFCRSKCNVMVQVKIGYIYKYCKVFTSNLLGDVCLAQVYTRNLNIDKSLLEQAMTMVDSDPEVSSMVRALIRKKLMNAPDVGKTQKEREQQQYDKQQNKFVYGIDEWFINAIFVDTLKTLNQSICVLYYWDFFPSIVKESMNWKKVDPEDLQKFGDVEKVARILNPFKIQTKQHMKAYLVNSKIYLTKLRELLLKYRHAGYEEWLRTIDRQLAVIKYPQFLTLRERKNYYQIVGNKIKLFVIN